MKSLQVCLAPPLLEYYELEDKAVVVIDILRATSTITTALAEGAQEVIPVSTLEEAKKYKDHGYMVGAERKGQKQKGFDFGNSPLEYRSDNILDQSIILSTTNGTLALESSKNAAHVFTGSFLNISALQDRLLRLNIPVLLFCAGWKGHVNMEDTLFAGALAHVLSGKFAITGDDALVAQLLYECAQYDIYGYLRQSSHYKRLVHLGIEEDIRFCLQRDIYDIVPTYSEGSLRANS